MGDASLVVLGVCGLYSSGKNQIAQYLEERGFYIIDLDRLGHQALRSQKNAVVRCFGEQVLDSKGEIDRRILGSIVFSDPCGLADLEGIVHPHMKKEAQRLIALHQNTAINGALLFKMELHKHCDSLIWVEVFWLRRLLRAHKRDSLSIGKLIQRFLSQRGIRSQAFSSGTDIFIVKNNKSLSFAYNQVEQLLSKKEF